MGFHGLGLRFFDTAPLYGYGNAELRLGEALAGVQRQEYAIETKVGRLLRAEAAHSGEIDTTQSFNGEPFYKGTGSKIPIFDFTYAGAMRSFEESLSRLGVDRVDIVQVHDPDDHVPEAITGAFRALGELRDQGVIGAFGIATDYTKTAVQILRAVELDCVLIAGRITLLDQDACRDLLPQAAKRGISVIAAGIFNSGILADPVRNRTFDYVPASPEIVQRATQIATVCARHKIPIAAAALQFPLRHPSVASVLVGARTPDEIKQNIELFNSDIPEAMWSELADVCGVPIDLQAVRA